MARAFPFARLAVHGRRLWTGARIHERQLRAGARIHGRRPRVGRHGERTPPAAHTLTPTLLPTTCVVVNKLVGLTLSDNRGCAPPVRKCLPPTAKSPQEGSTPRTASQTRLSRLRREEASSCAVRQQCVTHSSPQRGTVSIPASPGCCPALHRAPRSGTSLRRFRGTRERLSDRRGAAPVVGKCFSAEGLLTTTQVVGNKPSVSV